MNKLLVFTALSLFSCNIIVASQEALTNSATTSHKVTPVTDLIIDRLRKNQNLRTNPMEAYEISHGVKSGPRYATSEGILTPSTHTPSEFLIFYNLIPGFVDITAKIYNDGNPDAPASVGSTEKDEFSVCHRQSSFYVLNPSEDEKDQVALGKTEYLCRASIPVEVYLKKMEEFRKPKGVVGQTGIRD